MISDQELTKSAAEGIMGWHFWDQEGDYNGPTPMFCMCDDIACFYGEMEEPVDYWRPLFDWRSAGEIVDKMRADGWDVDMLAYSHGDKPTWTRVLMRKRGQAAVGGQRIPDPPRALTIAALLACKVVTEDELTSTETEEVSANGR